jgi:hypothetical protein
LEFLLSQGADIFETWVLDVAAGTMYLNVYYICIVHVYLSSMCYFKTRAGVLY